MAHLVERSVAEAQAEHAQAIVLDVNTFGGLVSAATEIRDALLGSAVPVDAYVTRAWSAGALVSLSAAHIAIAPTGSIGAAEPIPTTVKTISALRAEFETTASRYHRDPTLAAAMVDPQVDAPAYKAPGAILTLTADQARQAGIAEADRADVRRRARALRRRERAAGGRVVLVRRAGRADRDEPGRQRDPPRRRVLGTADRAADAASRRRARSASARSRCSSERTSTPASRTSSCCSPRCSGSG